MFAMLVNFIGTVIMSRTGDFWLALSIQMVGLAVLLGAGMSLWRTRPRGDGRQIGPGDGTDEAVWRRVEDERLQRRGRRGVD